jgi:hypothetical protein
MPDLKEISSWNTSEERNIEYAILIRIKGVLQNNINYYLKM